MTYHCPMAEQNIQEKVPPQARGWSKRIQANYLLNLLPSDAGVKVLCLLGAFLTISFLHNHIQAYEDLWWPRNFKRYLSEFGYLKTLWVVFSGADLPTEYRTYALSRLVHFFLWSTVGERSLVFPLTIALSQIASSICLLHLLRRQNISEDVALAVAVIWLISPFLATWSFHRYSYLILPFQIVIATCLIVDCITHSRQRVFIVTAMGVACALSGEMFLIAGPAAILLSALASKSKEKLSLSLFAVAAMTATVIFHRLVWATFYRSDAAPQRFNSSGTTGAEELFRRTVIALHSVLKSAQMQITELSSFVSWKSIFFGLLVAGAYTWASGKRRESSARSSNNLLFGLTCGALGCLALSVILGVTILSGQLSETMFRRYGYVSLTLLLVCIIVCSDDLLRHFVFKGSAGLALSVFAVGCFTFSLHGVAIKKARAIDRQLISKMEEAKGGKESAPQKGVLFYVAANAQYDKSAVYSDSQGPMMHGSGRGGGREELLQSPFSIFWTAAIYCTRLMDFRFVGVPNSYIEAGKVDFTGYDGIHHPNQVGKVSPLETVVVANLSWDENDPLGQEIRVFDSFAEFEPYYFSRRVERGISLISGDNNWTAIDLGRSSGSDLSSLGSLPDRRYASEMPPVRDGIVKRYGLIAGEDSVYENQEVSATLSYYRTNRNGYFTYSVTFTNSEKSAEVALDFWEQWQSNGGRRLFEVEVSWDGGASWATLGSLDIFALNGREPVSLILKRRGAKEFQFRTKAVDGSLDIPMIQGLRVRKSS